MIKTLVSMLLLRSVLTISSLAEPPTHPYRVGSRVVTNLELLNSGTLVINYDVPFQTAQSVLPPSLGISNMQYASSPTQTLFSFSLVSLSSDLVKFSVKVAVKNSTYYSAYSFMYFAGVGNDDRLLTIYLQPNNPITVVGTGGTGATSTKIYKQSIYNNPNNIQCTGLLALVCQVTKALLVTVQGLLSSLTGSNGIGKQLYGSPSTQYPTVIKVSTMITFLSFQKSNNNPWSFYAYSNTTSLSDLSLYAEYSDSLQNVSYNCSFVIINASFPAPAAFSLMQFQYKISLGNSPSPDPTTVGSASSFYYMMTVSKINMASGNLISFNIKSSQTTVLTFGATQTYTSFVFSIVGFTITQCPTLITPYLEILSQTCYDVCPSTYYTQGTQCIPCRNSCAGCQNYSTSCTSCASNQYFNYVSLQCQNCPTGCLTCQDSATCLSCDSANMYYISGQTCLLCTGMGLYFQTYSSQCLNCPTGCLTCQAFNLCLTCDTADSYYMQNQSCLLCNQSAMFFDSSTSSCLNCSTGCLVCTNAATCTQCDDSMLVVLINAQCESCPNNQFFQSASCYTCPMECTSCLSPTQCASCVGNLDLVAGSCVCGPQLVLNVTNLTCDSCPVGQSVTSAGICETLHFQTVNIEQTGSLITICSQFNISVLDTARNIWEDYNLSVEAGNLQIQYQNPTLSDKSICFNLTGAASATNSEFTVIYSNNTNTNRIINPTVTKAIVADSQFQDADLTIILIVKTLVTGLIPYSGITFTTLIAASGVSIFMGFIQFAQITSLYIYASTQMPVNLKTFLSTILAARSCSMLPFQVPNPMQYNQLNVTGAPKYNQQGQDLYFLRGSLITIVQTVIILSFYIATWTIFRKLTTKNKVGKYLHKRAVKKFYQNCIVSVEVVQITLVFSAAATLTCRNFKNLQMLANYTTALVLTVVFLGIPLLNSATLEKFKFDKQMDTRGIYPGVQRKRKGSETYAFLRVFCLLMIAITLPLVDILVTTSCAIVLLIAQLYVLATRNLFKFRVMRWFKILHTLAFILFNFSFMIFAVIDKLNLVVKQQLKHKVGSGAIACLLIIYVCDIIACIVEIGDLVYVKASSLCKKNNQTLPEDLDIKSNTDIVKAHTAKSGNRRVGLRMLPYQMAQKSPVVSFQMESNIRRNALKVKELTPKTFEQVNKKVEKVPTRQFKMMKRNAILQTYEVFRSKNQVMESKGVLKIPSCSQETINQQNILWNPKTQRPKRINFKERMKQIRQRVTTEYGPINYQ